MATVRGGQHHRLFQQHVQAVFEAGARHPVMGGVPDRDHDAVQLLLLQHSAEVGIGLVNAIVPRRFFQRVWTHI